MLKPEIIQDIKKVAAHLRLVPGKEVLTLSEYIQNGGKFSTYSIKDGGTTWAQYCTASGFSAKITLPVSDEKNQKEIRVELKHTLSKTSWNHSFDSFDYLVCWEKRWTDFPKPVIELKTYVRS